MRVRAVIVADMGPDLALLMAHDPERTIDLMLEQVLAPFGKVVGDLDAEDKAHLAGYLDQAAEQNEQLAVALRKRAEAWRRKGLDA